VEAAGIEPSAPEIDESGIPANRRAELGGYEFYDHALRGSPRRVNKLGPAKRGLVCWWRRRGSNPRPQALHYELYMLIPSLISLRATRRAGKTCNQLSKDLTVQALNMPLPRSCVSDSWDPAAQARAGQKTLKLVFKQLARSCRRWQL